MLSIFDGLRDITLASVAFRLILSTLCGGIVGMGETPEDQVDMALSPRYFPAWRRASQKVCWVRSSERSRSWLREKR